MGMACFARELHAASHVVDIHGAYHRERAAIVRKVPNPSRLVVARRTSTQQSPTNAAGEIVEVGNRIGGGQHGQHTTVRVRTQSHDTPQKRSIAAEGGNGCFGPYETGIHPSAFM